MATCANILDVCEDLYKKSTKLVDNTESSASLLKTFKNNLELYEYYRTDPNYLNKLKAYRDSCIALFSHSSLLNSIREEICTSALVNKLEDVPAWYPNQLFI